MVAFVDLKRHTRLYASGNGAGAPSEATVGFSGGLLLDQGPVQDIPSLARWRQLKHTAPLAPGDSGGPVIDERGRLLGINAEVHCHLVHVLGRDRLWNYSSIAVSPDPAWIQALVEKDRAQRH
jgi:hypothetical protein